MTLHIIKLCVGVDAIAELADWQKRRVETLRASGAKPDLFHRTRQMPRRRDELLDGGSLYWVIKGVVQVRQRLLDLRAVTADDGTPNCHFILDPKLVATRPQPRRAFQGWRYLDPADAPPDLAGSGSDIEALPPEMRAELSELGLL